MDRKLVDELGDGAFAVILEPLKRARSLGCPVLGFDTEYDSKTHELVSFQLHSGERGSFIPCKKLTVDKLAEHVRGFIEPDCGEVLLVAYWSIAELQHLPVVAEALEVRSYGTSLDVCFYSRRHSLLLRVFDLARFFLGGELRSLEQVAASYGLEKVKGIDREKVSAASARSAAFRHYAVHDAYLCWAIAHRLREGFAPDSVDPLYEGSAASTAAAVFRRGLVESYPPPASRVRLMGLLSCWGGRAEAIERGRWKRCYEYDLVSAYPRAAISLRVFPVSRSWRRVDGLADCRGAVGGIGRFRFVFPRGCQYPCLPVWTKRAQLYPLAGETYCTLDEIRLAVSMRARVRVIEAYAYWDGTPALSKYMLRVTNERARSADPVRRTALKLLANALIGKLAQRVTDVDVDALIKYARSRGVALATLARMSREEVIALGLPIVARLGSMFMPEWNGLITGRVRAIVSRAVAETQAVYVSTDAVWSPIKKAPSRFLGGVWELKRTGAAVVARTRLAQLGEHVAHHSIWRRDAGLQALAAMEKGGVVRYTVRRPLKLRESLRKGERYGVWIEEEREASTHWDNKRSLGDGGSRPWPDAAAYLAGEAVDAKARRQTARGSHNGQNGAGNRDGAQGAARPRRTGPIARNGRRG